MKYWILIFLIIIIDQLTKYYSRFVNFDFIIFKISYVQNTGAAFGILQGYNIFLVLVSIIIGFIVIYYMFKVKKEYALYGLSFVLAGTIGNLIDRIFFGYVRDFIDFRFWPAFNIADSFITVGAFILIYLMIIKKI